MHAMAVWFWGKKEQCVGAHGPAVRPMSKLLLGCWRPRLLTFGSQQWWNEILIGARMSILTTGKRRSTWNNALNRYDSQVG